MPLAVEQVEGVGAADGQAQRLGLRIEVDRRRGRRVRPPQVDRQVAVEEDPDVVVAGELQGLAAAVGEVGVRLQGEVEVVLPPLVAEELAVDREEVGVAEGVDPRPGPVSRSGSSRVVARLIPSVSW